jgi:hypothetical protein
MALTKSIKLWRFFTLIYDKDSAFGDTAVVEFPIMGSSDLIPSHKLATEKLQHLSVTQRGQLLAVLVKYPEVFSDTLGLCRTAIHEVKLMPGLLLNACVRTVYCISTRRK